MFNTDVVRSLSQAVLSFVLMTEYTVSLPLLLILVAFLGAGGALYTPSSEGVISSLVDKASLQAANSMIAIANSFASTVGPSLGGLLVALAGPGVVVGVDAISFALSAFLVYFVDEVPTIRVKTSHLLADIIIGWESFISQTWLWVKVIQSASLNLLVIAPLMVVGATKLHSSGGGSTAWGTMLGVLGAGEVLGGLLVIKLKPRRPLKVALMSFCLFAAAPISLVGEAPLSARLLCFFLSGVAVSTFYILWTTTVQASVPESVLSRVLSYDNFCSASLLPLGYVLAGPCASVFGADNILMLAGFFTIASTLAILCVPSIRNFKQTTVSS